MKSVFLSGYCGRERLAAINEIKEIIRRFGFLIDFKMFSDISISFLIEIDDQKIQELYNELSRVLNLDDFEKSDAAPGTERTVLLNVTFKHATGDMQQKVPAVPG